MNCVPDLRARAAAAAACQNAWIIGHDTFYAKNTLVV
jgi:hypothetical protein